MIDENPEQPRTQRSTSFLEGVDIPAILWGPKPLKNMCRLDSRNVMYNMKSMNYLKLPYMQLHCLVSPISALLCFYDPYKINTSFGMRGFLNLQVGS